MQHYKVTVHCPPSVGERKGHLLCFAVIANDAEEAKALAMTAPVLQYLAEPDEIKADLNTTPICIVHERF